MLQKYVKLYARGIVLDMGTGSGIQALTPLAKAKKVYAVDVNKAALENLRKENKKIIILHSDLFSAFKRKKIKFDTIIFNPPYLPNGKASNPALDGGIKGFELIEQFLIEAKYHLSKKGIILLLFSSLSNKPKIDEILQTNLYSFQELEKHHIFFEDLFVYKIEKSPVLLALEKQKLADVKYLAHGKRGIVFTGKYKGKLVAIKTKRPQSLAIERMENEARILRLVNQKGIGPKFLFSGKDLLVYEFVKGSFFLDCIKKAGKVRIVEVINNLFFQLFTLDKLKINKEEMTRPRKHIIIGKKPVLIDFERAHHTGKPSNVTQFCSFLTSRFVMGLLVSKGFFIDKEKIIELSKQYKLNMNVKSLNKIKEEFR